MSQSDTVSPMVDLLVIGGGINGVGVARDAAGRGLTVHLCEQDDLAQHTSSASTKLIHGGLRYLEHYDFKLVRHALQEREVLLHCAPHIIHPMRFVLPHHSGLRPQWMIRLGLFLYDHLGGRKVLPISHRINLKKHPAGAALKATYLTGFVYSDCWVQDARLVVLNAMDAQTRGAIISTHTRCVALSRGTSHWTATLQNKRDGHIVKLDVKALVNAAGPWVEQVWKAGTKQLHGIRFVKGSHIVVPRLFEHDYAYIFQHKDGRVLFAIPFEDAYTLLGTTDIELDSLPEKAEITPEEVVYICEAVNEYLLKAVRPSDVVWSFSGVRPLYDDAADSASVVTRNYKLHLDCDQAPIVSVYGGKITTYRKLAEEVLDLLSSCMVVEGAAWTKESRLPGGDIPNADFELFLAECKQVYPWLTNNLIRAYAGLYGTCIHRLLAGCRSRGDLGVHFGGQLYEREVRYLISNEYAEGADDILWRRTKRGLGLSSKERKILSEWITRLP